MNLLLYIHSLLLDNAAVLALIISLIVFWKQYRADIKTDKFNLEKLKLQKEHLELQGYC